jgi:hypothetical protein
LRQKIEAFSACEEQSTKQTNKMSALPNTLIAAMERGEVNGCMKVNGQWCGLLPFSDTDQEKVIETAVIQDNYEGLKKWELALLAKRRGLPYCSSKKSDHIENLRAQDASGAVPTVTPVAHILPINYDKLVRCELYEICMQRGIKLKNGRRNPQLIQALREHDAASITEV